MSFIRSHLPGEKSPTELLVTSVNQASVTADRQLKLCKIRLRIFGRVTLNKVEIEMNICLFNLNSMYPVVSVCSKYVQAKYAPGKSHGRGSNPARGRDYACLHYACTRIHPEVREFINLFSIYACSPVRCCWSGKQALRFGIGIPTTGFVPPLQQNVVFYTMKVFNNLHKNSQKKMLIFWYKRNSGRIES
jgi:hypothetical protein